MRGAILVALEEEGLGWQQVGEEEVVLLDILDGVVQEQYPDRMTKPDLSIIGQLGVGIPSVHFNNHDDTTMPEVLRVMDKAAVLLDERL